METFIKTITKRAGSVLKEKFRTVEVKYTKQDVYDVVTEADLLSNEILITAIKKQYPRHGIISEETGEYQEQAEYLWIIDPLDGTLNFSTHVPNFGVMVALAKNRRVKLAAIYCPVFNEFVFAKKGGGAYLNGEKITCSKKKKITESIGCMSASLSPQNKWLWKKLIKKSEQGKFIINAFYTIAVETLYMANGRRDWKISRYGFVWDYAAPSLILKEAGCRVTTLEGAPWRLPDRSLVAANPRLHRELIEMVRTKKAY